MAELASVIASVARTLPAQQVRTLASAIAGCDGPDSAHERGVAGVVATPAFADAAGQVLLAWRGAEGAGGPGVATALRAAVNVAEAEREAERVQAVWTGPSAAGVPTRMTSAVIGDVAAAATERLLLLSYAAYKVPAAVAALEAARARGVSIDLVLETQAGSQGKLRFDAEKAFGELAREVNVWEWAPDRRPHLKGGRAVMHAKAIVADDHTAFVTSANLTGLGLDENIELGVMVEGGIVPRQIRTHVDGLVTGGVLLPLRRGPQ